MVTQPLTVFIQQLQGIVCIVRTEFSFFLFFPTVYEYIVISGVCVGWLYNDIVATVDSLTVVLTLPV